MQAKRTQRRGQSDPCSPIEFDLSDKFHVQHKAKHIEIRMGPPWRIAAPNNGKMQSYVFDPWGELALPASPVVSAIVSPTTTAEPVNSSVDPLLGTTKADPPLFDIGLSEAAPDGVPEYRHDREEATYTDSWSRSDESYTSEDGLLRVWGSSILDFFKPVPPAEIASLR